MSSNERVDGGLQVRRIVAYVESSEAQSAAGVRKAWAAAVIVNPFAGRPCADLMPFMSLGEHLGDKLGRRALAALGGTPQQCSSYGKGAIVGAGSELELAAAILHPKLGRPLRALLGQGKAIIPSTIKHGGPGTHLDVPLHGTDDEWDFALLDAMEVFIPGAPLYDEIVAVIAVGTGGRAFARVRKVDPS